MFLKAHCSNWKWWVKQLKYAILTTPTLHHLYYVQALCEIMPPAMIINETRSLKASFDTFHTFESEREDYETDFWFKQGLPKFSEFSSVIETESINQIEVLNILSQLQPELLIVFGTGKIKSDLISLFPNQIFNLHGGDPQAYRGLDSHLWAIYHGEFSGLVTTIHRLNSRLDDGDIVLQSDILLSKGLPLYALRQRNTEVCVRLSKAILALHEKNAIVSFQQRSKGRYYSFMPSCLKSVCLKKFEQYTGQLP